MLRFNIIILTVFVVQVSSAQEVFKKGHHYGLKYDGGEYYAAVFDEITIKEYFVSGRIGNTYYNLSRNKSTIDRKYRKFHFDLFDRLLVIGHTYEGTIDIMDETGEHYYLMDGPYNKVLSRKEYEHYGNDDLLTVRKRGKLGLYDWVKQKEILPTKFSRIKIHETCRFGSYFIYAKRGLEHCVYSEQQEQLISFRAFYVTDIYPASICDGYIIESGPKIGYCRKMSNGKYFLIKPRFDDIYFPKDDASFIIVENREKQGLYLNYHKLLKCKYEEISPSQSPYYVAIVKRKGVTKMVNSNGDLDLVREKYIY